MQTYSAYCLGFASEIALPELLPGNGRADVTVRVAKLAGGKRDPGRRFDVQATADEADLIWADAGRIVVRHGREMLVDPHEDADPAAVRLFLLGAASGQLLNQRGLVPLHASAVVVDGAAVCFVGSAGAGKSTLAAFMHDRGHAVLADDIVAIDLARGLPEALPGFPYLRLRPDLVAHLGLDPDRLPRVVSRGSKRLLSVLPRFHGDPLQVTRLYVLEQALRPTVDPEPGAEAAIRLLQNVWAIRSLHEARPGWHLAQCAALASRVPVRRLGVPNTLPELEQVAELVERDVS